MNFKPENFFSFFSNEKHQNKLIFVLLLLVCLFKLPSLLSSDIQPWDEGLYAVRVISIHTFNDFFDQSSHSVTGFDSGAHPPLIIWLGYFSTSVFGINEIALKIIPFIFSLLCIVFIIKTGKALNSFETGFFASLIFAATCLFSIYSKRFQFDIPVAFFIVSSFYYFILFIHSGKNKNLVLSGVLFGLCLMSKAIVGLYIPIILSVSFFLIRKKTNIKFSDILITTSIGLAIALPWYIFMTVKHGHEFTDVLFGFHLVRRALVLQEGIRPKGIHFFPNTLLNNIPIGILLFVSLVKDFKNFRQVDREKLFLWIWFITGIISISVFKTKLETYIIPFLTPACLLLATYLFKEKGKTKREKSIVLLLTFLNILWLISQYFRKNIKDYVSQMNYYEITIFIFSSVLIISAFYFVFSLISDKTNIIRTYCFFIVFSFLSLNTLYIIKIPDFENSFILSDIKKEIVKYPEKKIIYISSEYVVNPQFTYYFGGIDYGWKSTPSFELLDLKNGVINTREKLERLPKEEYIIIVERDNINTGAYPDSKLFVPERFRLVKKYSGYELYNE
jgi:4-amino-4-deoxy-L-arabinose transferase-like glycosyltransferase